MQGASRPEDQLAAISSYWKKQTYVQRGVLTFAAALMVVFITRLMFLYMENEKYKQEYAGLQSQYEARLRANEAERKTLEESSSRTREQFEKQMEAIRKLTD